jgi:hypothetical protein
MDSESACLKGADVNTRVLQFRDEGAARSRGVTRRTQ